MATRKLPFDLEENAKKRRRVDEDSSNDAPSENTISFNNLNRDCLVHILSFLEVEDMNTVAMCNQSWRDARTNESLDQTRTGTIVCRENSSIQMNAITENGRNDTFSGNRTRLKIVGVERLVQSFDRTLLYATIRPLLTGVTALDLSLIPSEYSQEDGHCANALIRMCPNVMNLNLDGVKEWPNGGDSGWHLCPRLRRLTWSGSVEYPVHIAVDTTACP